MARFIAVAAALLLLAGQAAAQQAPKAVAGPTNVDSWVLALSWSPNWCSSKAGEKDLDQCARGKKFGFVVHGLWPQFAKGDKPAACQAGNGVPKEVADRIKPVMPSNTLIDKEWTKHGACTGLKPADYFAKTRAAYDKVKLPTSLRAPEKPANLTVAQIEKAFADANPGLAADGVAVICRREKLSEVRLCLDKDLKFRDCGARVKDRCKGDALIENVR